ncbi:class I SAM-dependent methyltransferase [Endozoicomonas sp. SCSIO W0465]|uniref:class I SAM-dependent methyltransferase n=1 Tax=Endozoicomonas sp. SCSIO W0465 TaxID=2918516 RepID=UPI0020762EFF|nr:class I SAM-dependent methyltransferase [Endozoicomonas sp. SCSIO W0465]USE38309.1 class I SAM-dependent methyltransferase [Endozoicomonas sp. SCSIO W0465]
MSHFFTPDDYAIAVAESPVARYVCTPFVQSVLKTHQVDSVLDLRCSEGFFSRLALTAGAHYVVGVDQCPAMLERAIQLNESAGSGIEYKQADPTSLRLDGSFSLVFAFWLTCRLASLSHLKELADTLSYHTSPGSYSYLLAMDSESHARVQANPLAPDDCYGKKVQSVESLQDGDPFELTIQVAETKVHFTDYCWSTSTIVQCLEEAGFTRVNVLYPPVTEEGLKAKGDDYWAAYLAEPFVVAIEAFRA